MDKKSKCMDCINCSMIGGRKKLGDEDVFICTLFSTLSLIIQVTEDGKCEYWEEVADEELEEDRRVNK